MTRMADANPKLPYYRPRNLSPAQQHANEARYHEDRCRGARERVREYAERAKRTPLQRALDMLWGRG